MTSLQKLLADIGVFVICSVLVFLGGWHYGARHVQTAWNAQIATDAQIEALHAVHVEAVSGLVLTQYMDRYQVVLTQGATITKEITRYVTPAMDARYLVPWGFVRLYNGSARGALPDAGATGPADDSPAPVVLSDVASSLVDNFTACRANAEQLSALQDWIRQQQTVDTKKPR